MPKIHQRLTCSHVCGDCVHFPICSRLTVKNAKSDTDYCLWEEDYYDKEEE